MPMTGAQRVEKHRQGQKTRIAELEREVAALRDQRVTFSPKRPSKKRIKQFHEGMASGAYGTSRAAGKESFSFDSFLGGVASVIAMTESGNMHNVNPVHFEKAVELLLANNGTGEASRGDAGTMHAGAIFTCRSWIESHTEA